jgi:hypothetical protein
MPAEKDLEQQPWYKHPMVWLVITFPMTAVIAGTITIIIAINTEDALVVDDYYKEGLQINRVIGHDRAAQEMGLSAFVDLNSQTGEIQLSLSADKALQAPAELTFKLIHRTRSGQDQVTTLVKIGEQGAEYKGFIKPPVIEGRWTIQILRDNTWRLKQDFSTRSAEHVILNVTS